MTTTTHTPLPWVDRSPHICYADEDGEMAIIATCDSSIPAQNDADSAFIVDAVNSITPLREQNRELVEAAKMADHLIQQWRETGREPAYHQWIALRDVIQAALKHAEGK